MQVKALDPTKIVIGQSVVNPILGLLVIGLAMTVGIAYPFSKNNWSVLNFREPMDYVMLAIPFLAFLTIVVTIVRLR